jgi:hypothetical protein
MQRDDGDIELLDYSRLQIGCAIGDNGNFSHDLSLALF